MARKNLGADKATYENIYRELELLETAVRIRNLGHRDVDLDDFVEALEDSLKHISNTIFMQGGLTRGL
jgi:hypothetical protein